MLKQCSPPMVGDLHCHRPALFWQGSAWQQSTLSWCECPTAVHQTNSCQPSSMCDYWPLKCTRACKYYFPVLWPVFMWSPGLRSLMEDCKNKFMVNPSDHVHCIAKQYVRFALKDQPFRCSCYNLAPWEDSSIIFSLNNDGSWRQLWMIPKFYDTNFYALKM